MLVPVILLFLQAQYWHGEAGVAKRFSPPKNAKILGGHDIDITEAPYQVSISFAGEHTCGGTLIDKDIVLTSSDCIGKLDSVDLSYFRIRVGSSTVDDGGYLHKIEKVVIHPRHKVLTYNLAVVKLSTPVTFSDKVQAIQMKEQGEEVADGENVRITGWGMNEELDWPEMLQMVEVQTINWDECVRAYDPPPESMSLPTYSIITPQMMCAGVAAADKSLSGGDEGGPLVHDGKLAGVALGSFYLLFDPDTYRYYPDQVYTKVSALRSWIDQTVQNITSHY
ncbi:hypothetical protein ABMA27_009795 [Loxostege sticticalis]|uniref:trypsin n=1 Tax=Loxostege sticticalis TaxID=481309 RepID=A0ABR3H6R5_LOXSC